MAEDTQAAAAPALPPDAALELSKQKHERFIQEFKGDPFASAASMAHFQQIATFYAASQFVPEAFKGKPGDVLIALNRAHVMGVDPLTLMQAMYVIGGRPAFYTEFLIAMANASGRLKSPIRWTTEVQSPATVKSSPTGGFDMPNLKVTAYATDRDGERIETAVTTEMAVAEGWPKNAKYRSMPEHMLKWRAAAFLIRLYMGEVSRGFVTVEEAVDIAAASGSERNVTPAALVTAATPVDVASLLGTLAPAVEVVTEAEPVAVEVSSEPQDGNGELFK
jgi:hypothetical protein